MKCEYCRRENKPGAKFCENCGAALAEDDMNNNIDNNEETGAPVAGKKISENITLCNDGKYRWVYEMNLYKNPTVFVLVWKIFFFILLAGFVIMNVADAVMWSDFFPTRLLSNLKFFGYFLIGMTVLTALGCLVHAIMNGGKYCVLFEMDEKGINHKQMPQTVKKSELISLITVLAGLASGSAATLGVGLAAARTEMYSEFSKVRKIIAYPRRRMIKVNGLLSRNQVYTAKEDFSFVNDYIMSRTGKK